MSGFDSRYEGGRGAGRSDRGERGGGYGSGGYGHGAGRPDRGGFGRGPGRGSGGFHRRREECPQDLRAPFKDARDFLAGLIHTFGLPARLSYGGIEQARDGRQIVIDVRGVRDRPARGYDRDDERDDELGLLIGKRGNMLDALTVVTNAVMHREGDRDVFFAVDVEGYRARRRATLRSIALRAADRVLQEGVEVELEPMPPSERRIVHMALAAHRDVETESTGAGLDRRVVILARRAGRAESAGDNRNGRDRNGRDRAGADRDGRERAPARGRGRGPDIDRARDTDRPIGDDYPRDDRYVD
ncbi:MAG TPA: R3H domain-containing nucleic acid-binding protein [Candidatus Eremiobacteraceae bacterium]|nr:R3H domain-containing nucleic acid-binding protein [Candidatus Eremiobacteraceae bacterium]